MITRFNFNMLFSQAWLKSLIPCNIIAGFKTCGVYPYNLSAISVPLDDTGSEKSRAQSDEGESDGEGNRDVGECELQSSEGGHELLSGEGEREVSSGEGERELSSSDGGRELPSAEGAHELPSAGRAHELPFGKGESSLLCTEEGNSLQSGE